MSLYSVRQSRLASQPALGQTIYHLYPAARLPVTLFLWWFKLARLVKPWQSLRALAEDLVAKDLRFSDRAKLLIQFSAAIKLAHLMLEARCDHLHIHFAHVPTQIGMYASIMSGIPYTVTAHANDIYERPLLLRQKAERSKKFLTISEYNMQHLIKLGLPANKLALVRCGVSFQSQSWGVVEPQRHSADRVRVIGSLGRLVPKKGMATLIDSFASLVDAGDDVRLEIAGDGPLRATLEDQVQALGLLDRVTFLGALPHDRVAEWMRSLGVFALACQRDERGDVDGIPVVLMEALSQAVPIVSTAVTGIPELVRDQVTGRLVPERDSAAMASALLEILRDRERAASMVAAGQTLVAQEFSREVNVRRLLNHIEVDEVNR